jgi:hypothetical protein
VATCKHWEQCGGIVPQVKSLLPPSLHRSGHGEVKVRVNSMPGLAMNDRTLGDYQLHIQVLRMSDVKEIIPQIKLRVDLYVSLTQSHEGSYILDP